MDNINRRTLRILLGDNIDTRKIKFTCITTETREESREKAALIARMGNLMRHQPSIRLRLRKGKTS